MHVSNTVHSVRTSSVGCWLELKSSMPHSAVPVTISGAVGQNDAYALRECCFCVVIASGLTSDGLLCSHQFAQDRHHD